jgi:hypothetical protein
MAESRTRARAGCLVHGRISAPELNDPVECTIWDISPEGARLIVSDGPAIPDKIKISTPFSLAAREAEVCWRSGAEAGIRFLDGGNSSADDLAEQLRTAEARNAELVERLRAFQRRLAEAEARGAKPSKDVA